ncbi:MAG TPA: alanine--glyoxylate aminotransferase family protein [Candidatus Dormibacteraeota bacterium]
MASTPLLMIPGPTPVAPEVLAALAEPVRSHMGPENAASMLRIQEGIRQLMGSSSGRVHCFAGSGTLAQEVALVNHSSPGDRIVVVSHGFFSDRFEQIAETLGLRVDVLRVDWGEHADPAAVRALIVGGEAPAVVCLTHVETSTGVLADCAVLAATVRDVAPDAIIVVDGVCATGGVEEAMDEWDVDVVLTGAQKALGVPPGLAILAVSERARRRRESLGDIRAYYADLRRWDVSVDDPKRYFSTHAVSLIRALEVSLDGIFDEGLPARFERHRRVAAMVRDGMSELGFEPLTNTAYVAPTLSVFALPDGVDNATFRAGMAERGVIISACLGPWAGRGIRIGHMGTAAEAEATRTIDVAAATLGK